MPNVVSWGVDRLPGDECAHAADSHSPENGCEVRGCPCRVGEGDWGALVEVVTDEQPAPAPR